MNKIMTITFATALCVSALSVTAATTPENTDDGSAIGTSSTPQIKHQDRRIDKRVSNKSMQRNSTTSYSDYSEREMRMMDTDNNGRVSKDEFMQYHEQLYYKMKQEEDGGIRY
ncbi:MAG TPA: hypothetical protein VK946_06035 [Methylotenera sp.]|nr:hypothetical protein [Methylotenera sp.]